jgi:Spy/CpxP family protein refolding chaperone
MNYSRSVRAVAAALMFAAPAVAQNAVFNVKVAAEDGGPIRGATVFINDLAIAVVTDANGNATVTTPADQRKRQNLRVRAVGFAPAFHVVTLAAGSSRVLFELKRDTMPADAVPVASGADRARVPFAVAQATQASSAAQLQADPFGRFLFTPELVMQHQDAIGLEESQREALQLAIQQAQTQVIKMQWALALDGEKLTKALNSAVLDEKEVLAQVDRVIMIEREIKRAQMTMMIKIKNTLTAAQQNRLRQLRD